jgi:hypothetical protein
VILLTDKDVLKPPFIRKWTIKAALSLGRWAVTVQPSMWKPTYVRSCSHQPLPSVLNTAVTRLMVSVKITHPLYSFSPVQESWCG